MVSQYTPSFKTSDLTQSQKELLIEAIEPYSSHILHFLPKENRLCLSDGSSIVLKISNSEDFFYVVLKETTLSYRYKDNFYDSIASFFTPDEKRDDFLFDIYCFCIENEIFFYSNGKLLSSYIPSKGQVYIDLKSEPLKETLEILKQIKNETHYRS